MPDDVVVDDPVDLDEGTPPNSDADGAEGTPPEGSETETLTPEQQAWKDLQAKYPGMDDEALKLKVGSFYWNQTKALSQSAKAQRELELKIARLEGRLDAGTTPAEPPPPPPEVQELDAQIHGLEQRDAQVAQEQTDTLAALATAREKVGELKGLIKAAKEASDEDKVSRLEGRLETAEGRVDSIRDKLDRTVRERKDIAWNKARVSKEREWTAKLHVEHQAREESDQQELEETLAEIPKLVDASMTQVIDACGVPADPALREDLRETLRNRITIDLWKAGKDMPFDKVNVPGLLKQYTERYMKAHGIAKREVFRQRSEDKTRVSGEPPAKPAATPPAAPGRKPPVVSGIGALPPGMLRARRILEKKGY